MSEEQPEPPEEDLVQAKSKLRALAELAKQLKFGNIFRLSKSILLKVRAALRDVLQQDDHADDKRMAELLGAICMTPPDQPTELEPHLVAEFQDEFADLLRDSAEADN